MAKKEREHDCLCKTQVTNYHARCPRHGALYHATLVPNVFEKELKALAESRKVESTHKTENG